MAINISGILKTPQGSAIQNAEIIFEQTRTSTEVLAGTKFSVITNQTGNYSSSLGVGTYVFKVRFQDETQYRTVASNVIVTQSMNNYTLNQIIQDQSQLQDVDYDLLQAVIQARDQAAASAQAAQTSQATATTKASEASSSAQAALASKNAAQTSEANALSSKNAAQTSQTNAAASQTTATTKAGEASSSQTAAAGSQSTATTKATEATNSATLAQKWAANPENSVVSGGLYSALHYAAKAAQSAQTATGQLVWRGGWSAQAGTAPPTPTGTTQDFYRITQAGTILSVQYEVGDYIHWDNINSIWFKMDGTDSVTSVNGRTGAVVVTKTDVGLSAVNNWGASSQTNDASTTTYATTAGVKAAYDLAATKLAATANAVSATQLVTPRTINGTNFDGTANITTQNWGTSRNLTIGGTAKAVNGSADVSWSLSEIGAARARGELSSGATENITTDQFVQWLKDSGAFAERVWIARGSWSYAYNKTITDTGCGNIHLAGCTIEVISVSEFAFTIRIITPTTTSGGGTTGAEFVYVNNGSAYLPGWRRIYTTAWKPNADDVGAVNKAGDAMSGGLRIEGRSIAGGLGVKRDGSTQYANFGQSGDTGGEALVGVGSNVDSFEAYLKVGRAGKLNYSDGTGEKKVYHEGYKPTAADVDALPRGGTAVAAAKLATACTIGGVSFDGTANINLPGVNTAGNQSTTGNAATATKLATPRTIAGVSFDGSANISLSASNVGAVPTTQLLPMQGGTLNWADLVGKVPVINNAGVTELGRYLDMREQGANVDFQWRWDAGSAGANKLCLYNSDGSPVIEFNASGRFNVPVNGGDISGRVKVYGVNPMYEWDVPGKYSVSSYLTADNNWRFVQSNGGGSETAYRFVSFADGNFIARGAVLSDHTTGSAWDQFNTAAFRVSNLRTTSTGVYHKLISHQLYSAGNFHFENSLGAYADGATWDMLCHTLVSTDSGGTSRIWKFRNDGAMYGPTGNVFDKDGNIWGGAFGGASVTYWAINRFAPISDVRYKKNMTECDGLALDVIDKFRFYAYDWDDSKKIVADKHHVKFGVSAQELELIDKAYVKESEVHEVMGEDPTTIKTLDDSNLLTLALKAIQELRAEIEELKKR